MAKHRLTFFNRVEQPGTGVNWMRWISDPGTNNLQDAFEGGEPATTPYCIIDLSAAASDILGRQVAQSSNFTLKGITMSYRPHDSVADNESDCTFYGRFRFSPNTDHFKEMMQLGRKVEQAIEDQEIDSDSFLLSLDNDYSALRVGWATSDDVAFQTVMPTSIDPVGAWNLQTLKTAYNLMTETNKSNALFSGRAPGLQAIGWECTAFSGNSQGGGGQINGKGDYERINLNHSVGAGMILCETTHSSASSHQGAIEDDYQWFIGIDFEVTV